jgi:leucyl aminopeptidase
MTEKRRIQPRPRRKGPKAAKTEGTPGIRKVEKKTPLLRQEDNHMGETNPELELIEDGVYLHVLDIVELNKQESEVSTKQETNIEKTIDVSAAIKAAKAAIEAPSNDAAKAVLSEVDREAHRAHYLRNRQIERKGMGYVQAVVTRAEDAPILGGFMHVMDAYKKAKWLYNWIRG